MAGTTVIIGAGQAGVSLAFKLREYGYIGKIILVGEEGRLPYQRPPLSKKFLSSEVEEERLYIVKSKEVFEKKSIETILDKKVISVDRIRKKAILSDGAELYYDTLAFTTGAEPLRLPPSLGGKLSNVFTFRTIFDAKKMRNEFRSGRKLLVVGGGYIGLETAAVAKNMGMNVSLIEKGSSILQRVASKETACYFRELHRTHGVQIFENEGLDQVKEKNSRAVRVKLTSGKELSVDVIVSGIGIIPETSLAESSGLTVNNGIVVDEIGRTSDHFVFAAGDCTSFPYFGNMIRLESVQNAIEQAEAVALSILGKGKKYCPVPWFWSDQYGTKLQIAGLNRGYTNTVCRRGARGGLSIWYFYGRQFIAVDAINDPRAFMMGKKWLKERKTPDVSDLENYMLELSSVRLN